MKQQVLLAMFVAALAAGCSKQPESKPAPAQAPAAAPAPAPAEGGGEAPLSESKKSKILGMLGEESIEFKDLFDMNKAQQNIYEIENKLKDILNE